jgi:hypothetical protein
MSKGISNDESGPSITERNRRNGLKSRGPKTESGRQATDLSKIIHGARSRMLVIPGIEGVKEWITFEAAIRESLGPVGALEEEIAVRIASDLWRQRRIDRAELAIISKQLKEHFEFRPGTRETELLPDDNALRRLLTYRRQTDGSIFRYLHELQRLRAEREGRPVVAPLSVEVGVSSANIENLG